MSPFETKGYPVTATPTKVLEYNIHRKGLIAAVGSGTTLSLAIGENPGVNDYFILQPGHVYKFDKMVPVNSVWAKGDGIIVLGEAL